ncbi:MAG TPA: SdrD B-like domain-containing protein [Pyrinomonadaceae bacterium]|nr:SdrD B-like domain-containing protein [Pyrinomonadaceae bacterium]
MRERRIATPARRFVTTRLPSPFAPLPSVPAIVLSSFPSLMRKARPRFAARVALALAVALLSASAGGAFAFAAFDETAAGTSIANRAEASYRDGAGQSFNTFSETVTLQVRAVSAVVVTPDETEPSATVSPNERVVRPFRVCNAGNTPDFYTLTRAEVTAPATLVSLFYDTDANGTPDPGDRPAQVGSGLSPRVAPRSCVTLLAVVETNGSAPGSQLVIGVTARSNVAESAGGMAQDDGTIVNLVGNGAKFTSPDEPQLPPVKLVESRERVTAAHGQTLAYTIAFRNHGDVAARNAVLRDELPAELDYISGTLQLNGRALTDAADSDEGQVTGRRVEVRWAEVAVGSLVEIVFRARVKPGVQPGAAVVNFATISADNAPAAVSSSAVVVVNPFGLVYEARSNGATTIAGARVALLRDQSSGATLELRPDSGSAPNDRNENPFLTDPQGRWSFVLAPDQMQATRYFLNVTAQGFRARMIEVVVAPSASQPGLFTLTVRAADGMPVAQGGSFELTEEAVTLENLAAFALNVPMFETQAVEIAKTADRTSVEVGDVVSYRVEVHNATSVAVNDVTVRDVLPPSFHYAAGTARVEVPPAAARSVEPAEAGDALVFNVGSLRAGERAFLTYRVRVGANARDGEQFNTAAASGVFLSGERISTNPVRASVRVRRGLFSTQQIILGRVFEDANANGQFDDGEKPVPNVRLYLNNGQSVVTDSAGQYNFPSVNDGALVIALDPVTLPDGYSLVSTGSRDSESWTRLLRTPLGGGSLLRQNFALRPAADADASARVGDPTKGAALKWGTQQDAFKGARANGANGTDGAASPATSSREGSPSSTSQPASSSSDNAPASSPNQPVASSTRRPSVPAPHQPSSPELTSGTYTVAATETVEPVAAGAVRIVSPATDEVIGSAALEVEARVAEGWSVALDVEGARVPESKIGTRRVDHRNRVTTYGFVGINLRPGPNRIRATAVGPAGETREAAEVVVYGRGPAKRLEVVAEKNQLSAGGRDSTLLRVRAFDQWGHPAADSAVAVKTTAGRLLAREEQTSAPAQNNARTPTLGGNANLPATAEESAQGVSEQVVQLTRGEGVLLLVADNNTGAAEISATTGTLDARTEVRITPELRPSILVGLAEVSVGRGAPEMALRDTDESWRSRIGFFYRGRIFGTNLLTVAYDSERPLNRTAGRDRMFTLDPLERAYPIFGDSSTRYEDAQSNSKLYARLDRGRSYLLFGDFDTEHRNLALSGYARRLTGVKVHAENEAGDFVSVTGARPDTSYARDVFPGGGLSLVQLSHGDILPGSEVVVLEVRDRRNPERIISRETFVRSVDYNLDAASGQIFFLRHVSTFDYALNLIQIVVTYEHRAAGMSSAVYTGRVVKTFKAAGLRLGLSVVDQRQDQFGSFILAGIDGEKQMPNGGKLQFEYATSRGEVAFSGNLFGGGGAAGDTRHDGNAYRVEYEQPLPWREARLRAGYARADEGFLNPFGTTVTPGSRRAHAELDVNLRASTTLTLGLMDERNRTANVNNGRQTGSISWTERWTDRVRTVFGYDFRRYRDELGGRNTDSNLVTVGAEWQATDKLQFSVKREQNLGEADPTYPNQTTLAATYQYNQFTRVFLTQRLASAPIIPISDAAATGFALSGARRETAFGVETRLGRYTNLSSRYQLENGINGTDSFAVIGLQNRLPLSERLSLEMGYERGFHLAGAGESFNSATIGFGWQPTENFRTTGRYEWRDRLGSGHVITLGAAGRLSDNLTALARYQSARAGFDGRLNRSTSASAAVAWRPLTHDRAGLLFSYTYRDTYNEGFTSNGGQPTRDRADVLSADGYYQPTNDLELYGRFAFKFGDAGTHDLARVSTFTYLTQGRAAYRLGRYFDLAGEMRMLAQPSSHTRRTSYGAELGYWLMPDLRVGGGYNFTDAREPNAGALNLGRRGFYFVLSSKLSRLFDLFGTSDEAHDSNASAGTGRTAPTPTPTTPDGGEQR